MLPLFGKSWPKLPLCPDLVLRWPFERARPDLILHPGWMVSNSYPIRSLPVCPYIRPESSAFAEEALKFQKHTIRTNIASDILALRGRCASARSSSSSAPRPSCRHHFWNFFRLCRIGRLGHCGNAPPKRCAPPGLVRDVERDVRSPPPDGSTGCRSAFT